MIKKFSVDPGRVERLTARREALFEICRQDEADRNEKISTLVRLEADHARSRATVRRWVAPPSEIAKLAKLKAELDAAKARAEASRVAAQDYGRIADAVSEYATPRPAVFGGAMIKGFANGH